MGGILTTHRKEAHMLAHTSNLSTWEAETGRSMRLTGWPVSCRPMIHPIWKEELTSLRMSSKVVL